MQLAIDAKSAHLGHRAAATSGMVKELRKGRNLVQLLDALVGPWLEKNMPERVAEWESLTRFVRVREAEAAVGPVAGTGTPQGPVPAAPGTGEAHAA